MQQPRILLLVAGSALFGVAISHQSNQQKAEEHFKSIKVFKGQPADAVLPAMQFMSASLKVDCTFCHVEGDFASDAKQEKQSARHMILMQKEINDKNFGGRNQVTCATCHGGNPHPNALPPTNIVGRGTPAKGVTAEKVYSSYKTTAPLKGGEMLHLSGTVKDAHGNDPVDLYIGSNHRSRLVRHAKVLIGLGFDGQAAWHAEGGPAQPIPAQFNTHIQRLLWIPAVGNAAPTLTNARVGESNLEGKPVYLVRGNFESGNVSEVFAQGSGELRQVSYFVPTVLGNLPEVFTFGNYADSKGVQWPQSVVEDVAGDHQEYTFDHAEIVKEDSALLSQPK